MGLFSSIGKIVSSITSPVAGLISSGLDLASGAYAANASSNEASSNRTFQADMSGTAYQRAVVDMKAAGINPALAYTQGGASTPSGSVGDVSALNVPVGSKILANSSTAAQIDNTKANTEVAKANTAGIVASTAKTVSDTIAQDLQNEATASISPKARAYIQALGQGVSTARDAAGMYRDIQSNKRAQVEHDSLYGSRPSRIGIKFGKPSK